MKKPIKVIVFLVFMFIGAFAVLAVFVGTMDADKFRPQLADVLGQRTGRTITLDGPIAFSLGLSGVRVSMEEASIANLAGASRPLLARVGKLKLGVDMLPLLKKRLSVNELSVENADILLETDAAGRSNWKWVGETPQKTKGEGASVPASGQTPASARGVSLSIDNIKIVNSQIGFLDADRKYKNLNISSLVLDMRNSGAEVTLKGDIKGIPVAADVKTNLTDLLSRKPFSVKADATYNIIHLTLSGILDIAGGKADISAYEAAARDTKISGYFEATWKAERPTLRGTLKSKRFNPADFKSGILTTDNEGNISASSAPTAQENGRFFDDTPLPLEVLRAVDADLTVVVGEFPVNKGALKEIKAKLSLSRGNLLLEPVKALIGSSPVDVRIALNASTRLAHLDMGMIAKEVDLGDLQKISDMMPFMKGKAGANVHLAGDGDNPRDIASSFGGVIEVTAEKGEIFTGTAGDISSFLGSLFGGGKNDSALNCLAVRFIAKGGVLTDNGILIDSATSTVAGNGSVNLGSETINIFLQARPKLVDVGGLIPSLKIGGNLKKPKYSVNATDIVKNVVGSLMEGNVDVVGSNVPAIQAAPAGQNACVYTLDHPKKEMTPNVLPANIIDRASQGIEGLQGIGNSLVKGLLGQ